MHKRGSLPERDDTPSVSALVKGFFERSRLRKRKWRDMEDIRKIENSYKDRLERLETRVELLEREVDVWKLRFKTSQMEVQCLRNDTLGDIEVDLLNPSFLL